MESQYHSLCFSLCLSHCDKGNLLNGPQTKITAKNVMHVPTIIVTKWMIFIQWTVEAQVDLRLPRPPTLPAPRGLPTTFQGDPLPTSRWDQRPTFRRRPSGRVNQVSVWFLRTTRSVLWRLASRRVTSVRPTIT